MKFKVTADRKDLITFGVYALVLLYLIALAVVNIQTLATDGMEGLTILPFEAFSLDNIHYTLVLYIVCLIASFLSVKSHFFDFEKGFGLGITNGAGGGYSDWAREKDIKTDKGVVRVEANQKTSEAAGVPLICNGKELWVDNGEYHTLVMGATGSGKTQDTILPTIKVLAKKGESIICTDPKGELYEKTAGLLKAKGYNILLLNFRNPQNGAAWNPLSMPYRLYKNGNQDKAIELLDDLAANILYEENNTNQDPFWEKTAADYFAGIALAMFEDTTEEKININSINMTATVGEDKFGGSTYIKEYFSYKDPSSPAYVNASGTVMAPSDTKGSIISVFKQKVKLFASRENLSEMLSHSDIALDSIGKQKTAVFIIIQDEKKTYHSLATIFIKQVYETLIDVAQANGGKLPVRTNFLLDEFANMPPLKDVTTMITAARSRQIRFIMIIQNFAQLNKVYGKDDAETIKGNCGNIIYLISTELAALEEISKLCGEKKSKSDAKTASTPLVTISDLQRMKQFDHIVLRMRKSPFKTSFVPDFKIEWGDEDYGTVEYPVREKKPVEIFDIREFVQKKKDEKMGEAMSSLGFPGEHSGSSGGMGLFPPPRSGNTGKKDSFAINDLVKRIDEKLAALEKEEEEERKKQALDKSEPNGKPMLDEPFDDLDDMNDFLIPPKETKPKKDDTSRIFTPVKEEKETKPYDLYDDLDRELSEHDDLDLYDQISAKLEGKEEPVSKPVDEKPFNDDYLLENDIKSFKEEKKEPVDTFKDRHDRERAIDNILNNRYEKKQVESPKPMFNISPTDIENKVNSKLSEGIFNDDIENKVNNKLSEDFLNDDFDLLTPIEKTKEPSYEEEYTYEEPVNNYKEENKTPDAVYEPVKKEESKEVFNNRDELTLEDVEEDEEFFDDFFDD